MLIIFKKAIIGRLNRQADESVGHYQQLSKQFNESLFFVRYVWSFRYSKKLPSLCHTMGMSSTREICITCIALQCFSSSFQCKIIFANGVNRGVTIHRYKLVSGWINTDVTTSIRGPLNLFKMTQNRSMHRSKRWESV